jgi:polar amino acid transport system substrate-binding protein
VAVPHRSITEISTAGLISAIVLVLTACSPTAPSTPAQGSSTGGAILNRIVQTKQFKVGVVNDNPPFSAIGSGGNLEGYDIDIVNGIAADLGATPDMVKVDGPGRVSGLQTGQLDMSVADFSITNARNLVISFSEPYLVIHYRLVVAEGSPMKTTDDANQSSISIASPRGGTSTDQLKSALPQANVQILSSIADVKQALTSGQANAAVFDDISVASFLSQQNGKYKVLDGHLPGGDRIGVGIPKGDLEWARWIDGWIGQFNFSGQNAASFQKWFSAPLPSLTQ